MARSGEARGIVKVIRAMAVSGLACLIVWPILAEAADKARGAGARVSTRAGAEIIEGELIGVRSDAIIIGDPGGGTRTIETEDIRLLTVVRKRSALGGIIIGGLIGTAAGMLFWKPIDEDNDSEPIPGLKAAFGNIIKLSLGFGVGVGVGGTIAKASNKDKTYDLSKMDPPQRSNLLITLRKQARMPSYQ